MKTRKLLRRDRLDYVIKYFYVWAKENGQYFELAKDMYIKHIIAVTKGVCIEPDNIKKNNPQKYIVSFDALIDSVKSDGLRIIDFAEIGAHRTACLIYFYDEYEISDIEFNRFLNMGDVCFDSSFFLHSNYPKKYLKFANELYAQMEEKESADIIRIVNSVWNDNPEIERELHLAYMIKYFIRRKLVQTIIFIKRVTLFKRFFPKFKYQVVENDGK